MSQRTMPRTLALTLLMALLVALLAACGAKPAAAPQTPAATADRRDTPAQQAAGESTAAADVAPAAPTAAPAATSAPAAESVGGGAAGGDAAPASAPLPAPTGAPVADATRPRPMGQEASLKAGELDDNERFADYLTYLSDYFTTDVRPADVSERYLISVLDANQRPVMDARVTVYDGERAVYSGRTYADGRALFMPRLVDTGNASAFRVVAEYGQARAETTFQRGAAERVEVALPEVSRDAALRLDLLFMLDTTGSMEDELSRIQETIDSIAARIDAFTPRPDIRFGLVAYKDDGDEYVTRSTPFTADLAAFRAELSQLRAMGGGDTPEAVDAALYEAVVRAGWREEPAVRLVFLVADAGPHITAGAQFTYLDGTREAAARGVKIYPIAASNTDPQAEYVFRQLAQQTMAGFVFLTYQAGQSGGAPGESTTLEAGEQPYTVERLDDLIVGIVERELAAAVGAR